MDAVYGFLESYFLKDRCAGSTGVKHLCGGKLRKKILEKTSIWCLRKISSSPIMTIINPSIRMVLVYMVSLLSV